MWVQSCVGMVSLTSASRYQSRPLDVHPRSGSTELAEAFPISQDGILHICDKDQIPYFLSTRPISGQRTEAGLNEVF